MIGNALKIINFLYQHIKDDDKLFEIKEFKYKRSKSQNSYAWELIGKLADKMTKTKDEMYLQMLKDYGQSEIVSIKSDVNPIGYFKYYEKIGKGYINGKEFTHYKIFKGSSNYDTKEMSIFIDGIIQECSNLGIPTLTDEQIKEMRLI